MKPESFQSFFKNVWTKFKTFVHHLIRRYHLIRMMITLILAIFLVTSAYLTFVAKTMNVENLRSSLERSTVVYDINDKKAGSLYAQKGTYVDMKNISVNVPNAILSTEDRNFYREGGFSVKGFGRAFYLMIKNKILNHNYISGGGSTITQQLVKNAYLSQQQTFSRKLKELFLSIQVNNVYSKNEILTMYMNNAYFGNGIYGVHDASERYFGTSVKNLPVQDAAVLAGMLTNPSGYNPVDHPKLSLQRRNMVLDLMATNHKITAQQAKYYKSLPINVKNNYVYHDGYRYPYYFDAVISEAINDYGLSEADIMNRGYKIYTNLNQSQQQTMQDNFNDPSLFPQNASDGTKVQAASIAVNAKTGGVQAVVGGRGTHVFRGYNRATQMKRQPGSTIKPLADYTPAIENGYQFDSSLVNQKKSYGSNGYTPENYNNVYTGKVPMYEALAQSMNAPAVWLLNRIGVDRGYESVKKFGLPVTKSDRNLSLALGGLSTGVSPQQMAGAYTAFANQGIRHEPFYIRKIVDASGDVIVNHPKENGIQVMSASTARQMTSMMLGVFDHGTAADAKPYGYSVAGKTGSTEDRFVSDSDATRDKWIIGYTPDIVVANWEGFDNNSSGHHLENLSGTGLGPLFRSEMQSIIPTTPQNQFKVQDAYTIVANQQADQNNSNVFNGIEKKSNQIKDNLGKDVDQIKKAAGNWWNSAKKWLNGK